MASSRRFCGIGGFFGIKTLTRFTHNIMISDQTFKIVLDNLSIGLSIKDSCILAGIARKTFYNIKNQDKKRKKEIIKAEMMCKKRCVGIIQKAIVKGDARVAMMWLERKHSDEFAETKKIDQKTEITGDTRKSEVTFYDVKKEELKKLSK